MTLINGVINYVDKTYQQWMDKVTERAKQNTNFTDWTRNNVLYWLISYMGAVLENLSYQLDFIVTEFFISTAKLWKTLYNFAVAEGYRVKGRQSATVELTFFIDSPTISDIFIPAQTRVDTLEGVPFFTLSDVTLLTGTTSVTVEAINQDVRTAVYQSDGTADQTFTIQDSTADKSTLVTIGGVTWVSKESFLTSFQDSEDYVESLNQDKIYQIRFGNALKGKIPLSGEIINVQYGVTDGADGNVAENTITQIQGSIPTPSGVQLFCTNLQPATGGTDAETTEDLKQSLPTFKLTTNRAVTRDDFQFLAESYQGVNSAKVFYDCGKFVDIVVTPDGGGTATSQLLEDVTQYFDSLKMVTVNVQAINAGIIEVTLGINVFVEDRRNRQSVESNVKNAVVEYMSSRPISDYLSYGNLHQVIEAVDGVSTNKITELRPRPYARPIEGNTTELVWSRRLEDTSIPATYTIKFIDVDRFELFLNNAFQGVFDINVEYVDTNIRFTIESAFLAGQQWSFQTYKINDDLDLRNVPAYPVSFRSLVTVTSEFLNS